MSANQLYNDFHAGVAYKTDSSLDDVAESDTAHNGDDCLNDVVHSRTSQHQKKCFEY